MDLPGALAIVALLVAMLLRPMEPGVSHGRPLLIAAAAILVLGAGAALAARVVEPMSPPPASET